VVDKLSLFVVLGQVMEDEHNVLDKINAAFLDPEGQPYANIWIVQALPIHNPYNDPPGLVQYLAAHGVLYEDNDGGRGASAMMRSVV
jgi:hypothetical protein